MTADVAIVGGGIIGLALADAVLAAVPGLRVDVHEKEASLGAHASGRNSGVLHAGFYYSPDSLKARLTRRGNILMRTFCAEHGVAVRDTGKVVVARNGDDLVRLEELHRRAIANGVPVEVVDEVGLRELEPLARTVDRALWSPTTGSADPGEVVRALAERVRNRGGRIRLGSQIVAAGPGWLRDARGWTEPVGHLVNCAGVHADTVARWFDVGRQYRMMPFVGLYWLGTWAPGRLRRHVYPVPDPRNPFLGVHVTVRADGRAKIGPTAIPALGREAYSVAWPTSVPDVGRTMATWPRFLGSRAHDVPALLSDELPRLRRRRVVEEAATLVPSIRERDFTERGRPGIRAQLFDRDQGRLEMDFVVRPGPRSTHVLNAVSPGWTTALALGEHIAPRVLDALE